MTKIRVHELSKELGIQSKDLIRILNELGAGVKNHMSTVDGEYLEQIRRSFNTGVKKGHTPARVNKQAPPKKDPKKDPKKEDARSRATDSKKKTTTSSGKKQSKTGEATKTKPAKESTLKKAEDRQKSTVKKSAKKEEPRREQR